MNFWCPLTIALLNFLAGLCKKGETLAAVSIIIVFLVIPSVNVNATKVSVRGKRPQNANHAFSVTTKAVANVIGSQ